MQRRAVTIVEDLSQYAEIDSGHAVQLEKPDELVRLARGFFLAGHRHGEN